MASWQSKSLKSAALLNTVSLAQLLMRMSYFMVTARLVPPQDFGLAAMAITLALMAAPLSEAGMTSALVRWHGSVRVLTLSIFWLQILLGLTLAALFITFAPALAAMVGEPQAAPLIAYASLAVFAGSVAAAPWALLQRAQGFGRIALCEVLALLTAITLSLTLVIVGLGAFALVSLFVAQMSLRALFFFIASGFALRVRFSAKAIAAVWPYSRGMIGAQLVELMANQCDRIIIGAKLGPASLGLYHQAGQINTTPLQLLSWGANTALYPTFSKLQDDRAALAGVYLGSTRLLASLALPVYAWLAAASSPAIAVILGASAQWSWAEAAPVLAALCLGGAAQAAGGFNNILLQALGRSDLVFRCALAASVATAAGVFTGTYWGIGGAAVGYSLGVCTGVAAGTFVSLVRLEVTGAAWLVALAPPALGALVMGGVVALLEAMLAAAQVSPLGRLAVEFASGASLYGASLFMLDPRFRQLVLSMGYGQKKSQI
jgi:O-antigen/teichoic acid export membrane protein